MMLHCPNGCGTMSRHWAAWSCVGCGARWYILQTHRPSESTSDLLTPNESKQRDSKQHVAFRRIEGSLSQQGPELYHARNKSND